VEAGPTPELALPSADRLKDFAPQAGHLTHMPSHIYVRVGQYEDATLVNELAAEADRSYIAACRAQGFYPGVYYPHNTHFLWYATSLEGRSAQALEAAQLTAKYAADNLCGPTQVLEAPRFRHLPLLVHLRFGEWDEVLRAKQPPSTNDFLVDRAMWHYARGMAFAAKGKSGAAAAELALLQEMADGDAAKALNNPMLPVTGILQVARMVLEAKVAWIKGAQAEGIAQLEEAVKAQDALPYMEPPFWYYPVRQTLGAALLESGDAERAEAVFREDLKHTPRNGWGLMGLRESLAKQGKATAAEHVDGQLAEAWRRADVELKMAWF
jgi:tetratricopeptide (TPR) repeat protein